MGSIINNYIFLNNYIFVIINSEILVIIIFQKYSRKVRNIVKKSEKGQKRVKRATFDPFFLAQKQKKSFGFLRNWVSPPLSFFFWVIVSYYKRKKTKIGIR